jgi:hypothetical protein
VLTFAEVEIQIPLRTRDSEKRTSLGLLMTALPDEKRGSSGG